MTDIKALLAEASILSGDSARLDAEVLLAHILEKPRSYLYAWPEVDVDAAATDMYRECLQRRARGEPVAYLTGCRDFWSLPLQVNRHTLIPRPATETLIEWSLELNLPEAARVVDLGTGSGAIALALAHERHRWKLIATDSSAEALAVAEANAVSLGIQNVAFIRSCWLASVDADDLDMIVSNPPYIAESDPHLDEGDVSFEPRSALVSGRDGLVDVQKICATAGAHLIAGGWLLLEHGATQDRAVRELLEASGFGEVGTRRDLDGLPRVSGGRWQGRASGE